MKPSKAEVKGFLGQYRLSDIQRVRQFKEGWVNYNYYIQAKEGKFVLQLFGVPVTEKKLEKTRNVHKCLLHLKERNFPYKIPEPVLNKQGERVTIKGNKGAWLYPYIEGNLKRKINNKQLEEIGSVLAQLHRLLKKEAKKEKMYPKRYEWQMQKLNEIQTKKAHTEAQNYIKRKSKILEQAFAYLKNYNFKKNVTFCHKDINAENMLWQRGKLVGILDFDNMRIGPRIEDIALAISKLHLNKKEKAKQALIKGYERIQKLNKEDKTLLIPCMIKDASETVFWLYENKKIKDTELVKSAKNKMALLRALLPKGENQP